MSKPWEIRLKSQQLEMELRLENTKAELNSTIDQHLETI